MASDLSELQAVGEDAISENCRQRYDRTRRAPARAPAPLAVERARALTARAPRAPLRPRLCR